MAERRMFAKKVSDSDAFIKLSSAAQALYFHLCQGADDDGFNNQVNNALFKAHATIKHVDELVKGQLIIQFESGVIAVRHWRAHNALRKDRYVPTDFQKEMSLITLTDSGVYEVLCSEKEPAPSGCQVVAERLPSGCQMVALGKDSIGKVSIDSRSKKERGANSFDRIIEDYCTTVPRSQEKVKALLKEWLKVRKAKRAAMTDKSIELNLQKLSSVADESNMSIDEYLEEVIMRGWQAFYPISRDKAGTRSTSNQFLDIAKEENLF